MDKGSGSSVLAILVHPIRLQTRSLQQLFGGIIHNNSERAEKEEANCRRSRGFPFMRTPYSEMRWFGKGEPVDLFYGKTPKSNAITVMFRSDVSPQTVSSAAGQLPAGPQEHPVMRSMLALLSTRLSSSESFSPLPADPRTRGSTLAGGKSFPLTFVASHILARIFHFWQVADGSSCIHQLRTEGMNVGRAKHPMDCRDRGIVPLHTDNK